MSSLNMDDSQLRNGIAKLLEYHLAPHMDPKQVNGAVGELFLFLDCAAHRSESAQRVTDFLDHWGDGDRLREVISRCMTSSNTYAELTVTDLRSVIKELDELRNAARRGAA